LLPTEEADLTATLYPIVCQKWTKTKTYACKEMLFESMKLILVALNIAGEEYTRTTKQNNESCVASSLTNNPKKDKSPFKLTNDSMEMELK
jgi:hypothetical protein